MLSQKSYNLPSGFSVYKDYDGNRVKVDHDFDADGISDLAILCNSEKTRSVNGCNLIEKIF